MQRPARWNTWRASVACLAALLSLWGTTACDCGVDVIRGESIEVSITKPTPGPVSGLTPLEVKVDPSDFVRVLQVFVTPQDSRNKENQTRRIAEMYTPPFRFQWNTHQLADGFYYLQAVATNNDGVEQSSKRVLVQIVNDPPQMWFVNCVDGQFIRGIYPLVLSYNSYETTLKEPPKLFVEGEAGPVTLDQYPPFRYLLSTLKYPEGKRLSLAAEGEDTQGKRRRITCFPRVDNTPPTLKFRQPAPNVLLGKSFTALFDAFDRFGVREVRLWVDGNTCEPDPKAKDGEDPNCRAEGEAWISVKGPLFPINVTLSSAYSAEQPIVLTARAVDFAGNLSDPPAQLRVRVDPVAPQIFIRSPGKSQVLDGRAIFTARITDNHLLKHVEFLVQSGTKAYLLWKTDTNQSELTHALSIANVTKQFGYGKKYFVVRALDQSGNKAESKRLFSIGCGDSTDCPPGKICHKYRCLVPAGLNQPCSPDKPCAVGTECVPGTAPICTNTTPTFCRQRCNPGNKFVSADACPPGFFCAEGSHTCMPGDPCIPLSNDCGPGKQCVPADDDTGTCVPVGNTPDGSPCDSNCTANRNCRRGSWCVYLLNILTTACLPVCDLKGSKRCAAGQRCNPLHWSFGGGRLQFGVCE